REWGTRARRSGGWYTAGGARSGEAGSWSLGGATGPWSGGRVAGPTAPSAGRPCLSWNAFTPAPTASSYRDDGSAAAAPGRSPVTPSRWRSLVTRASVTPGLSGPPAGMVSHPPEAAIRRYSARALLSGV